MNILFNGSIEYNDNIAGRADIKPIVQSALIAQYFFRIEHIWAFEHYDG